MLLVKELHRAIELANHPLARFARGAPFVVHELDVGVVDYPPAARLDSEAKVKVLAVHEEAFVEQSGLFKRNATEQHAGTHHGVDIGLPVLRQVGQIVASEVTAAWEEPAEAAELIEGNQRSGGSAATGAIKATVRTMQPGSANADIRVGVEKCN
jgi:hypothetical protein